MENTATPWGYELAPQDEAQQIVDLAAWTLAEMDFQQMLERDCGLTLREQEICMREVN